MRQGEADVRALNFVRDRRTSTIAYDMKSAAAVADRAGRFHCPVNTPRGGHFTNRAGTTCGVGGVRRLINRIKPGAPQGRISGDNILPGRAAKPRGIGAAGRIGNLAQAAANRLDRTGHPRPARTAKLKKRVVNKPNKPGVQGRLGAAALRAANALDRTGRAERGKKKPKKHVGIAGRAGAAANRAADVLDLTGKPEKKKRQRVGAAGRAGNVANRAADRLDRTGKRRVAVEEHAKNVARKPKAPGAKPAAKPKDVEKRVVNAAERKPLKRIVEPNRGDAKRRAQIEADKKGVPHAVFEEHTAEGYAIVSGRNNIAEAKRRWGQPVHVANPKAAEAKPAVEKRAPKPRAPRQRVAPPAPKRKKPTPRNEEEAALQRSRPKANTADKLKIQQQADADGKPAALFRDVHGRDHVVVGEAAIAQAQGRYGNPLHFAKPGPSAPNDFAAQAQRAREASQNRHARAASAAQSAAEKAKEEKEFAAAGDAINAAKERANRDGKPYFVARKSNHNGYMILSSQSEADKFKADHPGNVVARYRPNAAPLAPGTNVEVPKAPSARASKKGILGAHDTRSDAFRQAFDEQKKNGGVYGVVHDRARGKWLAVDGEKGRELKAGGMRVRFIKPNIRGDEKFTNTHPADKPGGALREAANAAAAAQEAPKLPPVNGAPKVDAAAQKARVGKLAGPVKYKADPAPFVPADKDGYVAARVVPVGSNGMHLQADANKHVKEGGDIRLVPDDFLYAAMHANTGPGKRFERQVAKHGVNETTVVRDTVDGKQYVIKKSTAGLHPDEHLNEPVYAQLFQELGLPVGGVRMAGPAETDGAGHPVRPFVLEHINNYMDVGKAKVVGEGGFRHPGAHYHDVDVNALVGVVIADAIGQNVDRHQENYMFGKKGSNIFFQPIDNGLGIVGRNHPEAALQSRSVLWLQNWVTSNPGRADEARAAIDTLFKRAGKIDASALVDRVAKGVALNPQERRDLEKARQNLAASVASLDRQKLRLLARLGL